VWKEYEATDTPYPSQVVLDAPLDVPSYMPSSYEKYITCTDKAL
jgi:hypothetical protein